MANRPINFNDPSGHILIPVIPILVVTAIAVVGWLAFAPPAYAPSSQEDLAKRSVEAEARVQTRVARWIDKHPILYVGAITTAYYVPTVRKLDEIVIIPKVVRIAPFGNATKIILEKYRTITGNLPHVHARFPDSFASKYFRVGIGWHRPWDDIINIIQQLKKK